MIRLLSGDLTRWEAGPSPWGAPTRILPQRDLRPDRRSVHRPRREHLSQRHRGGGERRWRVTAVSTGSSCPARTTHGHGWSCRWSTPPSWPATSRRSRSSRRAAGQALRTTLGVSTEVVAGPADTPSSGPSTRRSRVIDERDLFREIRGPRDASPSRYAARVTKGQGGRRSALSQLISAVEAAPLGARTRPGELYTPTAGKAKVIGITGAARQRQEHADRRTRDASCAARRPARGGRGRGPFQRADRRRDPRGPDPDGASTAPGRRGVRAVGVVARRARGARRATADVVAVLDPAGWDMVVVETVGVGQDEVDIMRARAHGRSRLGARPRRRHPGDEGRPARGRRPARGQQGGPPGRHGRTVTELRRCCGWPGRAGPASGCRAGTAEPSALTATGVSELADELARHQRWLSRVGRAGTGGCSQAAAARIRAIAEELLLQRLGDPAAASPFAAARRRGGRTLSLTRTPRREDARLRPRTEPPTGSAQCDRQRAGLTAGASTSRAASRRRSRTGRTPSSPVSCAKRPETQERVLLRLRRAGKARLHPGRHRRHPVRGDRAAGPLPVHPGPVPDDVSRQDRGRCARSRASARRTTRTSASST